MNDFLSVLATELTPQVVFAFVGGILGGLFAMILNTTYNMKIKSILVILSGFAGGALGDYLYDKQGIHSIYGLCFAGAIAGVPVGFGLEAIRLFAPSWFDKLLNKLGDKALNKLD